MRDSSRGGAAWTQPTLFDGAPIEIRLRIGYVPSADHVQIMVESFAADTGTQLSMRSWPALTAQAAHAAFDDALQELLAECQARALPFL